MGTGVNWNHYTAAELKPPIESGAGVSSMSDLSGAWHGLAGVMRGLDVDVQVAMKVSGATWRGRGSDAASDAVSPFTTWAQQADGMASQSNQSSNLGGEFYSNARNSMPGTITTVTQDNFFEKIASPFVTTDQERTEKLAAEENAQARQAMYTYDANAYSDASRTYFESPPVIATSSSAPAPGSTPPGSVGAGPGSPAWRPRGGDSGTGGSGSPDSYPPAAGSSGSRAAGWTPSGQGGSTFAHPGGAHSAGAPGGPSGPGGAGAGVHPGQPGVGWSPAQGGAATGSAGWTPPATGSAGPGGAGGYGTGAGGYGAGAGGTGAGGWGGGAAGGFGGTGTDAGSWSRGRGSGSGSGSGAGGFIPGMAGSYGGSGAGGYGGTGASSGGGPVVARAVVARVPVVEAAPLDLAARA